MFSNNSAGGGRKGKGKNQDLLDKIKQDREKRNADREQAKFAVRIQSVVRSRVSRNRTKQEQRESFVAKCSDLNKLKAILNAAGKPFEPSSSLVFSLVSQLLFFFNVKQDLDKVPIVSELCLTSIASSTSSSNILNCNPWNRNGTETWRYLITQLCSLCLVHCCDILQGSAGSNHDSQATSTLRLLVCLSGASSDVISHCNVSCGSVETSGVGESSPGITHWFALLLVRELNIYSAFGTCMEQIGNPTEDKPHSPSRRASWSVPFTLCLSLLRLCHSDSFSTEVKQITTQRFVTHLLGVPLLGYRLLTETFMLLLNGFQTEYINLLCYVSDYGNWNELHESNKHESCGLPWSVWTLGNVLQHLRYVALDLSSDTYVERDVMLRTSTQAGTALLDHCPESLFSGNIGVVWISTSNAHSHSVVVPEFLQRQLNLFSSETPVAALCNSMIKVSEQLQEQRNKQDAIQWETKLQPKLEVLKNVMPSLEAAATKSIGERFKDLFLTSSWGRKLKRITGQSGSSSPSSGATSASLSGSRSSIPNATSNLSSTNHRIGPLRNTSNLSRSLASGKNTQSTSNSQRTDVEEESQVSQDATFALCELFAKYLSRWPPHKLTPRTFTVLNALAFTPNVISKLWTIFEVTVPKGAKTFLERVPLADISCQGPFALLAIFCAITGHFLLVVEDDELYKENVPMSRVGIRNIILVLKEFLYRLVMSPTLNSFAQFLRERIVTLMNELYSRHSRLPLVTMDDWLVGKLNYKDGLTSLAPALKRTILSELPYAVPFSERVREFQSLVKADRQITQPAHTPAKYNIRVNRASVFEDGFRQMNKLQRNLRSRLYIVFVNEFGQDESGIDAGGLFKEFWTTLSATAFNPEYGLFKTSPDHLLFPNPESQVIHDNHLQLFEFLGRILGKALYEGIVVQPRFTHFFLSKFINRFSFIGDLSSLDPELYKNLMFLKSYEGDVQDLCLTFSITETGIGQQREIDLVPGGSNLSVTSNNRLRYINLVAHYYLNIRAHAQSTAFLRGFNDLINPEWITMFTQPELQTLMSGSQGEFSLEDMKKYTSYQNGYFSSSKNVQRFWKIFEQFSDNEKAMLLKFVTSCERPPLLGFGALHPRFTIVRVSIRSDDERLPSASTCFNQLKLPTYSSQKIMKEKLLYAITSGTGFEMS